MKIYYFNDEQVEILIQVNGKPDEYKVMTPKYFKLPPATGKVFEFSAPLDSSPYVKKWKDKVLLSYISNQNLPQIVDHEALDN